MEKKFLVSFLLAVSVLFIFAATVSAAGDVGNITNVEINGVNVASNPAIVVGDTVTVRVDFSSIQNASDITVQAEIEGDRNNVQAQTATFDVESGKTYTKSLDLVVPFDLKDTLSGDATLTLKIRGSGYSTEQTYTLRVQRTSYDASILSVEVPQTVKAGDLFPVDVVMKNLGYNNLNDLYVTATIPALGIEKTVYFGDIVSLECNDKLNSTQNYGVDVARKCSDNGVDTVDGQLYLQLPWNVQAGTYAVQVTAHNSDTSSSQTAQVAIQNDFSSGNFIVSGNQLLIVNPTNQLVVYRLVPESTNNVAVTLSDSMVAVPAGGSRSVTVSGTASSGTQNYVVDVFTADGSIADKVSFSTTGSTGSSSPIVVLTVILAIIFIVLLVVLIVLIGKKPEKSEEFGESYY